MFRFVTPHLKAYIKQFIIGPFFKLVEAALELTIPVLMSMLIDNGIAKNDTSYILKIGGVMLLIIAVGLCSALVCQYSASVASQGFGTSLRNEMFKKINSFSHREIDKFGTASLTNRLTNDINQLQLAVAMIIRLVIRAPFIIIGSVIAAILIDLKMSLIFIVAMPIFILVLFVITKVTFPIYKKVQQRLDIIAVNLREYLSGIRVIRAFATGDAEKKRFNENADEFKKASIKVGKISVLLSPLTTIIMNLAIIAIIWVAGIRVNVGELSQGQILAFINYITQVLMTLVVLSNLIIIFTKASASLSRVNEVMSTETAISNGRDNAIKPSTNSVEFDNVSFAYYKGTEPQIKNISFKLIDGQSLGIIGGTGEGKSTLINLIPRFYDATDGEVMFCGKNVREYKLKSLRENIGIVPQKAELFSASVMENILMGAENATADDAISAAKAAQAFEFIDKMPQKFGSRIERGGTNLSGGQKSRLCIARALARKPRLLILDDSLAALDLKTDFLVRQELKSLKISLIIVSQRVAAIRNCDNIIVLEDGEAVAYGDHEQLLETSEKYREICASQNVTEEGATV